MRHLLVYIIICIAFLACKIKKVENYSAVTYTVKDSLNKISSLDSIISPYQAGMADKMNEIIGFAEKDLINGPVESTLGNFVTDVTYKSAIDFVLKQNINNLDSTNTMALLNFGGLRAPINKGSITVGNIFELMPFDNEIVIVKLEPSAIKDMLAYLFIKHGQPISNAKALLSSSENKLDINKVVYNFDKPIYVITSDYLASGGDKMNFFKSSTSVTKTGILIRNALIDFIKSTKGVLPSKIEGRIDFFK